MADTLDSADWSDTDSDSDDESQAGTPLQSRAYQIEMFEHSMRENIIAVMSTGSGKTLIAKLRIEAEIERSPGKLIWFTAPSVVLAHQQYNFLSKQLSAYQFKLITGHDNPDHWNLELWQQALQNIKVIVSTPAILDKALNHAFVSLRQMSLFVFDEAHHCVKEASLNSVMKKYNDLREVVGNLRPELPCILRRAASPIKRKNPEEVWELEKNLHASCKIPVRQLEEYTGFVNMPKLVALVPVVTSDPIYSTLLRRLNTVISDVNYEEDPLLRFLRQKGGAVAQQKLEKYTKKQRTPALDELRSFLRSCVDVQENLGAWSCDTYIKSYLMRVEQARIRIDSSPAEVSSPPHDVSFIASVLRPMAELSIEYDIGPLMEDNVTAKVNKLVEYLATEHQLDLRVLIFVKTKVTAWCLALVMNDHPLLKTKYNAFHFVGLSNPSYGSVFHLAELQHQLQNLEKFRKGRLNVCVATSVLEEGVDVPAMNLVICFDERPNFRSFIQSRGRARHKNSRFILFPEAASKAQKFEALEAEMQAECQKSLKEMEAREAIERLEETGGEVYRVAATGAMLTFLEARQLLEQFCAKLPRSKGFEVLGPVYILAGVPGANLTAKVYLPNSLPAELQIAASKSAWRTEKKVKQDAAFQAFQALHKAGLVTDHLLPPELPKMQVEDIAIEKKDSVYDIQGQYDPWRRMRALWPESLISGALYAHRLCVEGTESSYADVLIVLPVAISEITFPLYTPCAEQLQVAISSGILVLKYDETLMQDVTFLSLMTVLGRRLQGITKEQLPFHLVPTVDPHCLDTWYTQANSQLSLEAASRSNTAMALVLAGRTNNSVPYIWHTSSPTMKANTGSIDPKVDGTDQPETIAAEVLPRTLEYLDRRPTTDRRFKVKLKELVKAECIASGLPVSYARSMLLIPSITHMLEIMLRVAAARAGPLRTINFSSNEAIAQALTLPSASSTNYERLEFCGDNLLKFYASLQVFSDHPDHPEGQLNMDMDRIVNNARLQRAVRELGLDEYITRHKFSGPDWRAGVPRDRSDVKHGKQKQLSSKTLADVAEATIGAASLEDDDEDGANLLAALTLFIPEITWRSKSANISRISIPDCTPEQGRYVAPVESLLGHTFRNPGLLLQALTTPGIGLGACPSYERLEFLGDAVLDQIVKPKLFRSSLNLSPSQMTLRRAALTSHAALAFFSFRAAKTVDTFNVTATTAFHAEAVATTKTVYLHDYLRRSISRQTSSERETTLTAYEEIEALVLESFATGEEFPWSLVTHLGAPKTYSDVIESVLAAIFIDSPGDLKACEAFLEKIGYMALVRRFVDEEDIDARHPETVLVELLGSEFNRCKIIAQERTSTGTWRCKVLFKEEKVAQAKGARCKEEARCLAMERAAVVLRKSLKRKRKGDGGTVERMEIDGEEDGKEQGERLENEQDDNNGNEV